jgi:hypothetical protein
VTLMLKADWFSAVANLFAGLFGKAEGQNWV